MEIEDLDVLRPTAKIIRIGQKEIDVSFIPCGITFEIDLLINELNKFSLDKLKGSIKELELPEEEQIKIKEERQASIKKAFELSLDLCAAFCSHKYPEMDKQWFKDNTDALQVQKFSAAIRAALVRAYAGVKNDLKN
jgi:hypothetical protein